MDSLKSVRHQKETTVAEEAVNHIKLRQIEREHRSIGSILDNRKIYDLDEIVPHVIKENVKNEVKLSITLDDDTIEKNLYSTKDFQHEEIIWKNKAKSPTYSSNELN